jgi:hypothetical protein
MKKRKEDAAKSEYQKKNMRTGDAHMYGRGEQQ